MLGGKKEIDQLIIQVDQLTAQIKQVRMEIAEFYADMKILIEEKSEPEDPYANLRNRDGFLSTQEYKRRKAGLGGE